VLGGLHVAYSRAAAEKVFVQNTIRARAEELGALLNPDPDLDLAVDGGVVAVYVSTDSASQAREIQAALVEVSQFYLKGTLVTLNPF
jgi:sulfite reductase alpha subunit-like flavoprotein